MILSKLILLLIVIIAFSKPRHLFVAHCAADLKAAHFLTEIEVHCMGFQCDDVVGTEGTGVKLLIRLPALHCNIEQVHLLLVLIKLSLE